MAEEMTLSQPTKLNDERPILRVVQGAALEQIGDPTFRRVFCIFAMKIESNSVRDYRP